MTLTIYVDVLFLLNMVINYLILSSTAIIKAREYNAKRLLLASAFGAFYSTLIFFPKLNVLNIVLFKTLTSIVIIFLAFRYINVSTFIKTVLLYYIINFVYGGGIYVFYRFTALGSKMCFSNGEYYIDMPLWAIIVLSLLFYFLIKFLNTSISNKVLNKRILDITISIGEKSIDLKALIDTGNNLYDPVSMLPVALIQSETVKELIPYDAESIYNDESFYAAFIENRLKIIPYKDAAGNENIIYAFKPTKISITSTGEMLNDMLLGIVKHNLSSDKSYSALLHSKTYIRR